MQRLPVDATAWVQSCPDDDLIELHPLTDLRDRTLAPPEPGTKRFDDEAEFIVGLTPFLDLPLDEVAKKRPDLRPEFTQLSWFLRDIQVIPYQCEQFVTTLEDWEWLMKGNKPKAPNLTESFHRPILTPRDMAAYVHSDDPVELWMSIADKLRMLGVEQRMMQDIEHVPQTNFAQGGRMWWYNFIAKCISRTLHLTFRIKHKERVPRLMQYFYERHGKFAPMVYAEANPAHTSRLAGHSMISLVLAHAFMLLWNRYAPLPDDVGTVGEHLLLAGGNVGVARMWAQVHYESDHYSAINLVKAMARRLVEEAIGHRL